MNRHDGSDFQFFRQDHVPNIRKVNTSSKSEGWSRRSRDRKLKFSESVKIWPKIAPRLDRPEHVKKMENVSKCLHAIIFAYTYDTLLEYLEGAECHETTGKTDITSLHQQSWLVSSTRSSCDTLTHCEESKRGVNLIYRGRETTSKSPALISGASC